jgi:acetolactate synthase-1/2/3 large subunit
VTILVEKLPVKIMMLNNQHLGTVVQWEYCFCKADCVYTYLGDPEDEAEIFHNFARWLKVTRYRLFLFLLNPPTKQMIY